MFRMRLLTFCTVPHAAQFAPTLSANSRWQPLQLLMLGPDAISLLMSGGMSTISKRLDAVSFWRKMSSSRRMRLTSSGAEAPRDADFALNYVKRQAPTPEQQQQVLATTRIQMLGALGDVRRSLSRLRRSPRHPARRVRAGQSWPYRLRP